MHLHLQAQIAGLEATLAASAAKAAALKARVEQGEVAQGRLCLGPGAQGSGSSSNSARAAAAASGGQQEQASNGAGGQVALEDLSRAVAAAYQRCAAYGESASWLLCYDGACNHLLLPTCIMPETPT